MERKTEMRWIPVSKRKPNEYEDILVTVGDDEHSHVEFAHYLGPGFMEWVTPDTYEGEPIYDVIAWMPLPEPYKGAKE